MSGNQKILGIVSIVLGAFAIVFAWVTWVNIAALIAAIAGLVLAIMSRKGFAAAGEQSPVPTIGLVLSPSSVLFSRLSASSPAPYVYVPRSRLSMILRFRTSSAALLTLRSLLLLLNKRSQQTSIHSQPLAGCVVF